MKKNPKIIVVGDVHGYWSGLNRLINLKKPDIVLQCGDFGYWPRYHGQKMRHFGKAVTFDAYGAKPGITKVYFCDGNHEDHWALKELQTNEIQENVFYMKRGSTLVLPDGRTVLFIGGANSIDKNQRTLGDDYFPDETITHTDIFNLPDTEVDIVISHTCPTEFFEMLTNEFKMDNDSSRVALSYVLDKYLPKLWYFGHFHQEKTGYTKGCRWYALNMLSLQGCWKVLD
jgi:UDP-2,3-diacylglucosamine pyrophosphatase LpxH